MNTAVHYKIPIQISSTEKNIASRTDNNELQASHLIVIIIVDLTVFAYIEWCNIMTNETMK